MKDKETFALLRARTKTVWLKARARDHWDRVVAQGDGRPMHGRANAKSELEELLRVLTGPLVEDLRDEIVEIAAVDAALDLLDVLVREGLDQVLAERLGVPLFDRVGDGQADLAHGALVEVDLHGSLTLRLNWRVL